MKTKGSILALVWLALVWPSLSPAQSGGSFNLSWFTLDGGGGTSTGGGYSLSGTGGQPEAGIIMNAGSFSITGGFWSFPPGSQAPLLTVSFVGNRPVVSWPSPSTGFVLQQNTSPDSSNWVPAPETVADNGTNRLVILNPADGTRFYRLRRP